MYGKIFDSIYDGTLRTNWQALVTFQQLIILADKSGVVDMTPHAIHGRTGIPMDIIEAGLDHLSKPDPYSRSSEEDGRRIVPIDECRPWGWRLVNHGYYNRLRSMEDKREADRERAATKRKPLKPVMSLSVAESRGESPEVAEIAPITVAVPIAVTVPNSIQELSSVGLTPDAPKNDVQTVFQFWKQKLNHPRAILDAERQKKILKALKDYSADALCQAIDGCAITPHNMGHNDRGEVYDDICLILRSSANIERFMRNAKQPPKLNGGQNAKPTKLQIAAEAIRQTRRNRRGPIVQDVGPEPGLRALTSGHIDGNTGHD